MGYRDIVMLGAENEGAEAEEMLQMIMILMGVLLMLTSMEGR